jgi:Calcineurin-like phosphoesterase
MRLQLLSDLHLESHPHWTPTPAPGVDLLVLAGDIGSYQNGSSLLDEDFGLARFSPHHGWPTPVLFVPGNHEYDALDFDAAHLRLQACCKRLGITWLERETLVLQRPAHDSAGAGEVRFIGTTLWTDFDALALQGDAVDNLTEQLRLRGKAFRAANFYLAKAATTLGGKPWLAEEIREQALVCQQWLREALAANAALDAASKAAAVLAPHTLPNSARNATVNPVSTGANKTVVITHFAPSLRSADPRYGLSPSTAGFCNDLDDLLPLADVWLHGHLHCAIDYVQHGCRVVANPLGYARKGEQEAFRPLMCIDV